MAKSIVEQYYQDYLREKHKREYLRQQIEAQKAMSGSGFGSIGSALDPLRQLGGNYGNRQSNSTVHNSPAPSSDPFNYGAIAAAFASTGGNSRAEKNRACPHEGIRAGEIVAYRSWKIADSELRSTYTNFKWMPGQLECVGGRKKLDEGYGFFAFRDQGRAMSEAMNEMQHTLFAVGSLYMWGEIVEHETGYRSTHVAIKSIDFVNPLNDQLLERLRKSYVIPPKPIEDAA